MKYAYWGFAMLLFGSIGLIIIVMFESITLNNDSEYYVLREAMEAAMLESIDLDCYRVDTSSNGCGGQIKISEQKFVENFSRRFASSISGDANSYTLEFYDIIEMPPKASVNVIGTTKSYSLMVDGSGSDDGSFNLYNALTGILEFDYSNEVVDGENGWEEISGVTIESDIVIEEGAGTESVGITYTDNEKGESDSVVNESNFDEIDDDTLNADTDISDVLDDDNMVIDDIRGSG